MATNTVQQAAFLINGTPSVDPVTGDPIFIATNSQVLTVTLEVNPSPALSVTFELLDATDLEAPLASKNAPALTWNENSQTKITFGPVPTGINDPATVTMPSGGIVTYLIRCTVSTAGDGSPGSQEQVFERGVVIFGTNTIPILRKTFPGESTEVRARAFSDATNDMVDAIDGLVVGGSPLTTKGDLFTYDTANTRLPVGLTDGFVLKILASESTGLVWAAESGGGGVAGSNLQIQFNDNGAHGASPSWTFNNQTVSPLVTVFGSLTSGLTLTAGAHTLRVQTDGSNPRLRATSAGNLLIENSGTGQVEVEAQLLVNHTAADTASVMNLAATGTSGSDIEIHVGLRDPTVAAISANPGAIYHRAKVGVGSSVYVNVSNTTPGATWFDLRNARALTNTAGIVTITGGAPAIGQALVATSPTAAAWQAVGGGTISSVDHDAASANLIEVATPSGPNVVISILNQEIDIVNGMTFYGEGAGNFGVHSGANSTGVGSLALSALTTGESNSAFGRSALRFLDTGTDNTAIGVAALALLEGGNSNTAMGTQALSSLITGVVNTAVGFDALRMFLGSDAVAIGGLALDGATGGIGLVAVGSRALSATRSTNGATGIGANAFMVATGGSLTGIGNNVGLTVSTGFNLVLIGHDVDSTSPTATDELNVADTIFADLTTGAVRIGGSGVVDSTLPLEIIGTGVDDTTPVITVDNTSAGAGAFTRMFFGILDPSTSSVSAINGSVFFRSAGSSSTIYANHTLGTGTAWYNLRHAEALTHTGGSGIVNIDGGAPATGEALVATSPTAAEWQAVPSGATIGNNRVQVSDGAGGFQDYSSTLGAVDIFVNVGVSAGLSIDTSSQSLDALFALTSNVGFFTIHAPNLSSVNPSIVAPAFHTVPLVITGPTNEGVEISETLFIAGNGGAFLFINDTNDDFMELVSQGSTAHISTSGSLDLQIIPAGELLLSPDTENISYNGGAIRMIVGAITGGFPMTDPNSTSGAVTFALDENQMIRMDLTEDLTSVTLTDPFEHGTFQMLFVQDPVTARSVTGWVSSGGGDILWQNSVEWTPTQTLGAKDWVVGKFDGTDWHMSYSLAYGLAP